MSRASNTLKASDKITTPIKLKYAFTASSNGYANYGITVISGSNGKIDPSGSINQGIINYWAIRNLYYKNWLTGSLNFSASYFDSYEQSTACSGSKEYEYRYINTNSNSALGVISIPRNCFGEQIARNSFFLRGTAGGSNPDTFTFWDDGNGNLTGSLNGTNYGHVGNVIYSHGMVIITNQSGFVQAFATGSLSSYSTCSFLAETTIYQNEYRCHISENDFNYTTNPSAITSSLGNTGSYIDAITGSDFRPYATCVGLYNAKNELLVVGKLSTPYPISPNTDMTFVVRYDS